MPTTPWSEPEVEETKAKQLPQPPETIYVPELDPNSPEYKAVTGKRKKEDTRKIEEILARMKYPENNELSLEEWQTEGFSSILPDKKWKWKRAIFTVTQTYLTGTRPAEKEARARWATDEQILQAKGELYKRYHNVVPVLPF